MSQNPSYPVQPPPVQKASFWSRWWWMILLIIPLCCCAVVVASIMIVSVLGFLSPEINAAFGDISGELGVVPTPILRVATQAPMLEPTAMLPPTALDSNKPISLRIAHFAQFRAGKLTSFRVLVDSFDLVEQTVGYPIHLPRIAV